jgi:1,4-dihydroxy-2-naphthoate octaprenyltransferase
MLGTLAVTLTAIAAGLYLVGRGGWPLLVLGLLAILAMLAYTGGPFPLGYHGLGEPAVFIFFGLLGVGGSFYVQARELPGNVILAALPVGALIAAILVVNNLRDMATDAAAGKRTLAVRLGRHGTLTEFAALLAAAYILPPLIWLIGALSAWWLLTWLSLPLAARLFIGARVESGTALNRRLAQTAQLALVYSVLLAMAILL